VSGARVILLKFLSVAIGALGAAGPGGARLIGAGDGPERGRLERLARELGLQVEFTGQLPQPELFALFAESDVLLFPSLHDECGFVVLEGMASGLVPVVADAGGPPVLAGDAGLTVAGGGRASMVNGLAGHLRTLAADDELRAELRQRAMRRAASFEWKARTETIRDLYRPAPVPAGLRLVPATGTGAGGGGDDG
jgi:glycosyltransferase involved in cell wall biosynthesis